MSNDKQFFEFATAVLDSLNEACFNEPMLMTLIVRHPTDPEGEYYISQDTPDRLIDLIKRSKTCDAEGVLVGGKFVPAVKGTN